MFADSAVESETRFGRVMDKLRALGFEANT
jgi:hypothetical protein